MEGINFEEEKTISSRKMTTGSTITGLLIRYKIAENEKSASRILLVIAVLAIILGITIFFFGPGKVSNKFPPPPPTGFVPGQTGTGR